MDPTKDMFGTYRTGIWAPSTGPGIGGPGAADIFVSASDLRGKTALNQFSGIDWRDHYANFLSTHLYSRNHIVARFNEEIYVAISNGTNGHQYDSAVGFKTLKRAQIRKPGLCNA